MEEEYRCLDCEILLENPYDQSRGLCNRCAEARKRLVHLAFEEVRKAKRGIREAMEGEKER